MDKEVTVNGIPICGRDLDIYEMGRQEGREEIISKEGLVVGGQELAAQPRQKGGDEVKDETCRKCREWFTPHDHVPLCCYGVEVEDGRKIASVEEIMQHGWPDIPDWCPKKVTKSSR